MAFLVQRVVNYTRSERDQPVTFEQVMQALGHVLPPVPPPPAKTPEALQKTIEVLHGLYRIGNPNGRGPDG